MKKKNYKKTRNPRVQHSNKREQRKWSTENVRNKVNFPELNKDQALKWKGPAYNNYDA